jgi:hypothetical protein
MNPLMISADATAEVKIFYKISGRNITFFEKESPDEKLDESVREESFVFRVPSWQDTKKILNMAGIASQSEQAAFAAHRLVDAKWKILLKDWTLVDENGKKIPANQESIDKLPLSLITYVASKLNDELGPNSI